jgi:dTMP kinase
MPGEGGEAATVRLERGVLVVFEGIDGAGKTTQAARLAMHLRAAGFAVVSTKEPTAGPFGARLRASASTGRLEPAEELATFEADRREHVDQVIRPALAQAKVVIVDRYYFSTAAYQGARGLDPDDILARNETFAPRPDLLVLLDIPVDEAMRRIGARGDGNLFEKRDNLAACAAIFARLEGPYLLRLDGTAARETLHERIVAALDEGALARARGRRA